ncbi:iron chelate uptake ABC transporter family permease subunit [Cohnella lubricantis]|uniref:Iron chelate uptake ABC transporter family permease subunit n=1 Tax=Cohnella lubricantis TaxID=2163172 RepID=A0A841TBT4_9BACL|nr:iron chelate uptake ABC transporter family permease subunit [Cohnella lubricantis]MBB6678933.1 iron chelate uptake ABC transporter family permease subunit [Cohnella lubricantis]MBP2118849.1 iron complex transport system permease protein [Cohnella lubricantis]
MVNRAASWKIVSLAALALALVALFLFLHVGNWDYAIPRRSLKIAALLLTGCAIAFSTAVFQTITNNRILTPSILGLDSLFMLLQTGIVYFAGSGSVLVTNGNLNFVLSAVLMILFSAVLYRFVFRRGQQNLYFLLLIGLVIGTMFQSFSTFMEVLIDPNEFQVVQGKMFASFNNVNTQIVLISAVVMLLVTAFFLRSAKYLDVLSLGRDHAVNLGVPYESVVKRLLVIVSILISVSTALVGPITFLGLLVVNVAHAFFRTYRHRYLIAGSMLIAIVALAGGQLLVERVFIFSTPISVIINFVGGVYFLYLLLKENRA